MDTELATDTAIAGTEITNAISAKAFVNDVIDEFGKVIPDLKQHLPSQGRTAA